MTNGFTPTAPSIRFGMMVVYARDLQASIEFYRLLGLDVPDPKPDRPVAVHRAADGFTLLLTTDLLARRFDGAWRRPDHGYQQLMEFLVDDDESIDRIWSGLTAAGHVGITAPGRPNGVYATVVQDPDGNPILISNDPVAAAAATRS